MATNQLVTYNGAIPGEGPKGVPVNVDFTSSQFFSVDFTTIQQQGRISGVQTIYIDNYDNAADVELTVSITNQRIVCPANKQGYFPILVSNDVRFSFFCMASVIVPVAFLNFAVAASMWPSGGGSTSAIPNDEKYYLGFNGAWADITTMPTATLNYFPLTGSTVAKPVIGQYFTTSASQLWSASAAATVTLRTIAVGQTSNTVRFVEQFRSQQSIAWGRYDNGGTYTGDNLLMSNIGGAGSNSFGVNINYQYDASTSFYTYGVNSTANSGRRWGHGMDVAGNIWRLTRYDITGAANGNPITVNYTTAAVNLLGTLGTSAAPVSNVIANQLSLKFGAAGKIGTTVLVAGVSVTLNSTVTANSIIILTSQAPGGTPGSLGITAKVAGTSFTITSSNPLDTSTVGYLIVEPA